MRISDILRFKQESGAGQVWTIVPDATVRELLAALAEHHIGALVVADGDEVVGIVSERDIVRMLHREGDTVLDAEVRELMTREVVSAGPADAVDAVATLMTERRIRHLPVLEEGRLVGVVSIGDVVSSRMRELEHDREQLEQYIRS